MKYPLSYHQERLWFIDKFESNNLYPSSPIYHNIPLILNIKGNVDLDFLENCINLIISRHQVLQTRIITEDGLPYQIISTTARIKLVLEDLSREEINSTTVYYILKKEQQTPFVLDKDFLVRARIIKLSNSTHSLIIVFHHLIADKFSLRLFTEEMIKAYALKLEYDSLELEPPKNHYIDLVLWQREMEPKLLKKYYMFWKRKLSGKLQPLDLPVNSQRALVHIYDAETETFSIPEKIIKKLIQSKNNYGWDFQLIFLSVFKVLLNKFSGLNEIVIGTSLNNREKLGITNVFGPISNLVVLRTFFSEELSFKKLIEQIQKLLSEINNYQDIPFDKLVSEINPDKDMSRTALFDVLFQFESFSKTHFKVKDTHFEIIENNLGLGKYDINLLIKEGQEDFKCFFTYNKLYYNNENILRLIDSYLILLDRLIESSEEKLTFIPVISNNDKSKILNIFNDSQLVTYPKNKTIVELFEEQVCRTPDNIAVVFNEIEINYKELNEKSNQLAHYLRKNFHVQPNDLVGIMLNKGEWMIIAILAVLKSGGAYVPIDPDYPESRKKYIIEDSKCKVIIDDDILIKLHRSSSKLQITNLDTVNTTSDLAYVIYTSGTTGMPKGVLIPHSNVIRLFKTNPNLFDFTSTDVWTMFHSYNFDFSVWEMYGALLFGGKLIVIPRQVALNPELFFDLIEQRGVTILNQTPSSFYTLISTDTQRELSRHKLRYVIFGGESLKPDKLLPWYNRYPTTKLINMYGITETTVHVTYKEIGLKEIIKMQSNIGKPIPTLKAYILDQGNNLQPIGVKGELYISGAGLAAGYLNRPDLSAEKFIHNPFEPNSKMYKTGDLGRWIPDGTIEYLGRMDDQVKIRGYRIELGEIENAFRSLSNILDVVVVSKLNEQGENDLVAFIVSKEDLNVAELKLLLSKVIPGYMIPAYFVSLTRLPLTSNGKIDKKSLPNPSSLNIHSDVEYVAPSNDVEEKIVKIWEEVLGKTSIGIKNNFFDLGGHSLKVIPMLSKLKADLGLVINIADFYNNPTIEAIYRNNFEKDYIIKINNHKDQNRILLFFPPIMGASFLYKNLATLIQDKYNCYAFQTSGYKENQQLKDSVFEESLGFYQEFIQRESKLNDITLFGYSYGGYVAFEFAKILENREFFNYKLIILDIPAQNNVNPEEELENFGRKSLEPEYSGTDKALIETARKVLENNTKILSEYRTNGAIKSEIHYIQSSRDNNIGIEWSKHTHDKLIFYKLNCMHSEMLNDENIGKIQSILEGKFRLQ